MSRILSMIYSILIFLISFNFKAMLYIPKYFFIQSSNIRWPCDKDHSDHLTLWQGSQWASHLVTRITVSISPCNKDHSEHLTLWQGSQWPSHLVTRITVSISPQTGCSGCSWSWAPGWTLRPGCWWWRWMSWRCAHPEPCPAWWWHVWYKCYLVTSSYQTMRILFSSNFSSKAMSMLVTSLMQMLSCYLLHHQTYQTMWILFTSNQKPCFACCCRVWCKWILTWPQ